MFHGRPRSRPHAKRGGGAPPGRSRRPTSARSRSTSRRGTVYRSSDAAGAAAPTPPWVRAAHDIASALGDTAARTLPPSATRGCRQAGLPGPARRRGGHRRLPPPPRGRLHRSRPRRRFHRRPVLHPHQDRPRRPDPRLRRRRAHPHRLGVLPRRRRARPTPHRRPHRPRHTPHRRPHRPRHTPDRHRERQSPPATTTAVSTTAPAHWQRSPPLSRTASTSRATWPGARWTTTSGAPANPPSASSPSTRSPSSGRRSPPPCGSANSAALGNSRAPPDWRLATSVSTPVPGSRRVP